MINDISELALMYCELYGLSYREAIKKASLKILNKGDKNEY